MLEDMIHLPPPRTQDQFFIEDISTPITDLMFEFGEDDFFPETLQNSEVTSCSNYCYEDTSSYITNLSFSSSLLSEVSVFNNNSSSNNNSISSIASNNNVNTNNNLPVLYDPPDDNGNIDISASMNFLPLPTNPIPPTITNQEEQFELSTLQLQVPFTHVVNGLTTPYQPDLAVDLDGVPLALGYGDDCLSSLPYGNLDQSSPSCSLMDTSMGQFLQGNLNTALSADASGIYGGNILMGNELEFQSENVAGYGSDSVQQCYSSADMQQGLSNDNQQLVNGVGNSTLSSAEVSNLEESNYKVGRLSAEERKERIHRYMKKRNERNFSKKIKYACRKTLADSRPRVRGRFAKNDEFGEVARPHNSNHEDEDEEEVTVKEEDDIVDSDIFAHISGVNSFKSNYQLQSWI